MLQYKNHINLQTATKWLLKHLAHIYGYSWRDIKLLNDNRYLFVLGGSEPIGNILITYKRAGFNKFGKQFLGKSGVGDTINLDIIEYCSKNNVKYIFAIFPNDKIYYADFLNFVSKAYSWVNKEGKDVMSISIHIYEEFMGVQI